MNRVMPLDKLLAPILEVFPKGESGRRPFPAAAMLRIYFFQQWFNPSDSAMENSLYVVESMRRFAGLSLEEGFIPIESTILKFRHFLGEHDLTGRRDFCNERTRTGTKRSVGDKVSTASGSDRVKPYFDEKCKMQIAKF